MILGVPVAPPLSAEPRVGVAADAFGPGSLVRCVSAYGDVGRPDKPRDIVDVVEHCGKGRVGAEHVRQHVHAHQAIGVGDGFERLVALAAHVVENRSRGGVARHDGLLRGPGRVERSLLAAVGGVHDDADPVHLPNQVPAQLAQAGVRRLRAAVADEVSPVVGQVHQANA